MVYRNRRLLVVVAVILLQILYPVTANEKSIEVFFSGNLPGNSQSPQNKIIQLISGATSSFQGAFFELNNPAIVDALLSAAKKNINVQMVVDGDTLKAELRNKLVGAGIELVVDTRPSLMHHKFAVIDNETVVTGSYNLTTNSEQNSYNNMLVIKSRDIAIYYKNEFLRMYNEKSIFCKYDYPVSQILTWHSLDNGNILVAPMFTSEYDIEKILIAQIANTQQSIEFLAFSFTSTAIADELIKAVNRGVKVTGIIEKDGSDSKYSQYVKLHCEGIDVTLEKSRKLLHHKIMIFDADTVFTGSYNFSRNARSKNEEASLLIKSRKIHDIYCEEFCNIKKKNL